MLQLRRSSWAGPQGILIIDETDIDGVLRPQWVEVGMAARQRGYGRGSTMSHKLHLYLFNVYRETRVIAKTSNGVV